MRRACMIALALLGLAATRSQAQSLVESADGVTSVLIGSGAQASVNFGDKSIRFGLLSRVNRRWLLYGGEVKLSATDGVANVVKGGFHPPATHATVTLGWQGEPSAGAITYQLIFLQGSVDYLKMTLADTAGGVALRKPASTTASVTAGYNAFLTVGGKVTAAVGASVVFGGRNNYSNLDHVQLCTQVAAQPPRILQSCDDARLGPVRASDALSGAVDAVLFPGWGGALGVLGFTAFARHNPKADEHRLVPGLGLLFSKTGSPLSVVGGITVEFGSVTRVGVQVGLPF